MPYGERLEHAQMAGWGQRVLRGKSLAFVSQRGALWRLGASEGDLLRHKLCGPGVSREAVAQWPL